MGHSKNNKNRTQKRIQQKKFEKSISNNISSSLHSNNIVFCLIVKNESKVIENCFLKNCVNEGIKHALIVDTGSTDGTQDIIRSLFSKYNINGKLIEHSFFTCKCHPIKTIVNGEIKECNTKKYNSFDFAENRSYALDMCYKYFKEECSFIFMTDADDELSTEDNTKVGLIDYVNKYKNTYTIFSFIFGRKSISYFRPHIYPNNNNYKFSGSLHEYLSTKDKNQKHEIIKGNFFIEKTFESQKNMEMISGRSGARSSNPNKYKNDGLFLEKIIQEYRSRVKSDNLRGIDNAWRYVYYTGQSWKDHRDYDKAEQWFDYLIHFFKALPVNHKPWNEEVYNAYKYKIDFYISNPERLNKRLKHPYFTLVRDWSDLRELAEEAFMLTGEHRAEVLYYKAQIELKLDEKESAIKSLERASELKYNEKFLFCDTNIYKQKIPNLLHLLKYKDPESEIIKKDKEKFSDCFLLLIFTSHFSEINFYEKCKENFIPYINKVFSDNNILAVSVNSFTGKLPFKNMKISLPPSGAGNKNFDNFTLGDDFCPPSTKKFIIISVDNVIPKNKFDNKSSSKEIELYFLSSDNELLYDSEHFSVKYTKDFMLTKFLKERDYNGFIKNNSFETDLQYTEPKHQNYNFHRQRNINPDLLQKGLTFVPSESFKLSLPQIQVNILSNSFFNRFVYPLDRKILPLLSNVGTAQSRDLVSDFIKLKVIFNNLEKNFNNTGGRRVSEGDTREGSLREPVNVSDENKRKIYNEIRNFYNQICNIFRSEKDFFLYEHPENIIACIFIKEAYINFLVKNREYESFINKQTIIDKIINRKVKEEKNPKILLSMTSCKRFDFFKDTVNSILQRFNINELTEKIHTFLCIDDGSNEEDKQKMKEEFPFFEFVFNGSKGHSYSMNYIYDYVIDNDFDYVLHLEDDFLFVENRNYISDALDILNTDEKINQVCFNRSTQQRSLLECPNTNDLTPYVEYSPNTNTKYFKHFTTVIRNSFNEYFWSKDNMKNDNAIDGPVHNNPYSNIHYWKGFTFMPSLFSVEKTFKKVGRFSTKGFFEGAFAEEIFWNTPYYTAYFDSFSAYHLGPLAGDTSSKEKNAYKLNEKEQYSSSDQNNKGDLVLTNLNIPDSYKEFKEKNKDKKYTVFFVDSFQLKGQTLTGKMEYINNLKKDSKYSEIYEFYNEDDNPYGLIKEKNFFFNKDILNFDVGRFDNSRCNMTYKEMESECKRLGGNCFNTFGFVKKVPKEILNNDEVLKQHLITLDFFRTPRDGFWII